jgi:PAS domain S-box-containing protein
LENGLKSKRRLTTRASGASSATINRSSSLSLLIAALAMAGLLVLGWTVGKSGNQRSVELVAGGAALFLVFLVGWIMYSAALARRRAEDALSESDERFRLFMDGVHDYAMLLLDCEGVVVSWNAGAERMKGYETEEIVGRSFSLFYPPEDLAAGTPAMELKMAAERGQWEGSGWRVRANGTRFWANVLITALKDDAGNLRGFSKLTRDISQLKQTEEALLKAGALQSAIFNSANFSSIATDAQGIIQIFNVGAERMLGYSAAEVMNQITPADISDPQEIVERAEALSVEVGTPIAPGFEALAFKASRGIEDIYELTYVRKNGSRFPAVVSVTALRDTRGAIIGYLLIGTDNTARRRADEALRKSEAQLQAIIENLDEGVVVSDLKGALLESNHAAQELYGHANLNEFADAFELSGTDGAVLASGEWPLARILRGEKLRGLEVRIRRIHDDWQRVFSYGGTLVRDAAGQPLVAVVTIGDITERRRAADLICQLNTDLEQRIVERTAQLQTANKELEAFCYSVSHDLRTPLRSLDGFSQALLEDYADKLDTQGQNYLGRIRAGSQRMGLLIDDLLNLSQVSRSEMSRETVDLSKMAREVAEELQNSAAEREVEFVIASGLTAETDPRLLRIVLSNLFGNAWKFTSKRPHARIEFGCSGENGSKEYFTRDNGAGFDEAYADKLFGVFQRLHSARDFPGTGIGLATVQRIIHRQGGRIWAEGKVEEGATFHFTL